MKLISWNVNGLRACVKKGFRESILPLNADAICLQEIKMNDYAPELELKGYECVINPAEKKGYSGTAVFARAPIIAQTKGIGAPEHDKEGRVITTEFEKFYLVNCYTPNAQRGLTRLDYRMEWDDAFREYLCSLRAKKPVIACGDMNVAHAEIDLKHPKTNHMNAGFTDQERGKFSLLLDSGFIDTFRYLYPDARDRYTWWSYIGANRDRNVGWRIDYFIVSTELEKNIAGAAIHDMIMGSDHCPVELTLDI